MKSVLERSWISPFIAFSFMAISATGILMLCHVKVHAISSLHEWIGLIFVVAGLLHLMINWKGFLSCFKKKQSILAVMLVLALVALFLLSESLRGQGTPVNGGRGWSQQPHHR